MSTLSKFALTFLIFNGLLATFTGIFWRIAAYDLFNAMMFVYLTALVFIYVIAWFIVEMIIFTVLKRERKNAKRRKKGSRK